MARMVDRQSVRVNVSSSPACLRCSLELPLARAGARPIGAELVPLADAPQGIAELYRHLERREPPPHICGSCLLDLGSSW